MADEAGLILQMKMKENITGAILLFDQRHKGYLSPCLPSYKRKLEIFKKPEITVLTLKEMSETDAPKYVLSGSPTQMEGIFPAESNVEIASSGSGLS